MQLTAFARTRQGTGASRRLRFSGRAPGIVYGAGSPPQAIELDHNALWHALQKEAFHSRELEMELDGQKTRVVLRDVQYHPFRQQVLHVDFQRVDDKTRVHLKVPLHFEGLDTSPAVKIEGCTVTVLMHTLDVECVPAHLPEAIRVDLGELTAKSFVGVRDIALPTGVRAVVRGSNKNPPLISIKLPEVAPDASGEATPAAEDGKKKGKKK